MEKGKQISLFEITVDVNKREFYNRNCCYHQHLGTRATALAISRPQDT